MIRNLCMSIIISIAILLVFSFVEGYAQTDTGDGEPSEIQSGTESDDTIDIVDLSQRAKASLNSNGKLHIKNRLLKLLASDEPVEIKNQAAVRLAEIMIYSPGNLTAPESLLEEAKKQIPDEEFSLKAEAEYLLGIVDYIKSQIKTRSLDNEKKRLTGKGNENSDPFLTMAIEHFDTVLQYPLSESAEKAKIALEALSDPYSYEAFVFFADMGKLFDDNSRLDTLAVGKQYYRVIETYEKGNMKQIVESGSLEESVMAGILSDLSLAYFTSSQFDHALEMNKKGLDRFGKTQKTSVLKFNRAYVYKYMGKWAEAEQEYSDLLKEFPLTEDQYFKAGLAKTDVLIEQNKKQEAKELLKELSEFSSENPFKEKVEEILDKLN